MKEEPVACTTSLVTSRGLRPTVNWQGAGQIHLQLQQEDQPRTGELKEGETRRCGANRTCPCFKKDSKVEGNCGSSTSPGSSAPKIKGRTLGGGKGSPCSNLRGLEIPQNSPHNALFHPHPGQTEWVAWPSVASASYSSSHSSWREEGTTYSCLPAWQLNTRLNESLSI